MQSIIPKQTREKDKESKVENMYIKFCLQNQTPNNKNNNKTLSSFITGLRIVSCNKIF